MTLQDYLIREKISVLSLSHIAGIPYMTLSDIVKGKTDIDNAHVELLIRLAAALSLDLQKTYNLCKACTALPAIDGGKIVLKKGKYYLEYKGLDQYLCKASPENKPHIGFLAARRAANVDRLQRLDAWN